MAEAEHRFISCWTFIDDIAISIEKITLDRSIQESSKMKNKAAKKPAITLWNFFSNTFSNSLESLKWILCISFIFIFLTTEELSMAKPFRLMRTQTSGCQSHLPHPVEGNPRHWTSRRNWTHRAMLQHILAFTLTNWAPWRTILCEHYIYASLKSLLIENMSLSTWSTFFSNPWPFCCLQPKLSSLAGPVSSHFCAYLYHLIDSSPNLVLN